jgi:hypothetical protein
MAPFAAGVKNKDLVLIFLKCDIARPDPQNALIARPDPQNALNYPMTYGVMPFALCFRAGPTFLWRTPRHLDRFYQIRVEEMISP